MAGWDDFTDLRRGKLTQVDVLNSAPPWQKLRLMPVLCMIFITAIYILKVVPALANFGRSRWQEKVDTGVLQARPGGPFSEVSESFATLLSLIYVSSTFLALGRMERKKEPVTNFIFECVAVHNVTQCCYNLYCFVMLVQLGREQQIRIWGNDLDVSENSHALGYFMWLQYHCRQLQLVETGFMILQKKFKGASFLHVYLRALNLWGWFIACRCVCCAEAYVPALVSSACQSVIYGLYSSLSLLPDSDDAKAQVRFRASWVFRLQIAQYLICASHSLAAATWGHFPWKLAWLHLFVIANGLILYTEWFSTVAPTPDDREGSPRTTPRVVFSFDSCGWLFVYHFGVGAWLSEHLQLERSASSEIPEEVAFSGSSGGSLIACVLACGQKVRDVFDFIVEQQPLCRRNPTEMFPAVERALRHFQFEGAYLRANGRMRVLLTRITRTPPFVQGEVINQFSDNETTIQVLCASCHVPLFAGLLPRCIAGRFYYDGLVWPDRLLVPWRGAPGDQVIRISACAHPLADVKIDRVLYWWAILPPDPRLLRGIFWKGYRDCGRWFARAPDTSESCCGKGRKANHDPTSASKRWHGARKLLKKSCSEELPKLDPVTGEDVKELIEEAEHRIHEATQLISYLLTVALTLLLLLFACSTQLGLFW